MTQIKTLYRGLTRMDADQEKADAMVCHSRGRLCHTSIDIAAIGKAKTHH